MANDLTVTIQSGEVSKATTIRAEELDRCGNFEEVFELITERLLALFADENGVEVVSVDAAVVHKEPTPIAQPVPIGTLEDLMNRMSRAGRPRLSLLRGGWSCVVEMNTRGIGQTYEVRSDFELPSALSAAEQCFSRMRELLHT